MIDDRELRLGNFVYYGESIRQITAIGNSPQRKFVGVDNMITEFEVIKPIPLSQEILKKCGFEYVGYWQLNDIELCDMVYGEFMVAYLHTANHEIKHLHQLQNLYYALTGQELNYQPK